VLEGRKLFLTDLNPEYEGTFTCLAKNSAGESRKKTHLQIIGIF